MTTRDTTGHDQKFWTKYLDESTTYGTYEQRMPEYKTVAWALETMGLRDDMTVVDVGAGSCDFDHYLRTGLGWRGRYIPIDGSLDGTDLNSWVAPLNRLVADFVVSIETVEHVHDPKRLIQQLVNLADIGVAITTPNPDVVDVFAVDPTHVAEVPTEMLESFGLVVSGVEFSGRGDPHAGRFDTLIATTHQLM